MTQANKVRLLYVVLAALVLASVWLDDENEPTKINATWSDCAAHKCYR